MQPALLEQAQGASRLAFQPEIQPPNAIINNHAASSAHPGKRGFPDLTPPQTSIISLTSDNNWYTYARRLDFNTPPFFFLLTPRKARASPSLRHVVQPARRSRRRARDEELDASMACVGVTPSPPSTPSSPLRAPRRTRSSQMNAHPYARPSSAGPQAPKRRALSLTLGLNLNVAQLVAEEEEEDAFGGILSCLSAPAKLTPSLSTASLENCPLSLLSSSTSSHSSSSLSAISTASWPPSSASYSSDSSGPMTHDLPSPSISDCGRYTAPPTSPHESEDPPPPSGIPLRADDPTLAPFLSSQPSFSSLTTNIAIGDLAFAEDAKGLEREGITHIISVLGGRVLIPDCIPVENRLHVPLPDAPFAELVGALKPVAAWVQTAFAQGGVSLSGTPRCAHEMPNAKPVRILIHCAHGISRSPAVGAALLVAFPLVETGDSAKLETLSATAALEYVGARRPAADVNWGFRAQLSEWEQLCRNRVDG